MLRRRSALEAMLALGMLAAAPVARGQSARFFRIATGGVAGTYYVIGGAIATIVSSPPGLPCGKDASCGVPDLLAVAQTSAGSVANVEAVTAGSVETCLCQSDIAYQAWRAEETFAGQAPAEGLRTIACLYQESVHLVVRKGAAIGSLPDLRGRVVSIDEEGSGTIVEARAILRAFGLGDGDVQVRHVKSGPGLPMMQRGELDALFLVGGYPVPGIADMIATAGATLLPIAGAPVDRLLADRPYLSRDLIPADTYAGVPAVDTVSVAASWVASTALEPELAYQLVTALWRSDARPILDNSHAKGREIVLANAIKGAGVPIHEGAERYYREHGILG